MNAARESPADDRTAERAASEIRDAVERTIGRGPVAEIVVADLLVRHAERHRHYHTAEHVMWMLRHVDRLVPTVGPVDRDAVIVAALFHDAVYDPRSTTNETDSALLAAGHLRNLGWQPDRVATVARLIEATAGHAASDTAAAVLLDADLAVLGAPADDYATYVADVRAEYAFVEDDQWRVGRGEVLAGFLDRDRIYATAAMFDEREAAARRNLAGELRALQQQQQQPPRG